MFDKSTIIKTLNDFSKFYSTDLSEFVVSHDSALVLLGAKGSVSTISVSVDYNRYLTLTRYRGAMVRECSELGNHINMGFINFYDNYIESVVLVDGVSVATTVEPI